MAKKIAPGKSDPLTTVELHIPEHLFKILTGENHPDPDEFRDLLIRAAFGIGKKTTEHFGMNTCVIRVIPPGPKAEDDADFGDSGEGKLCEEGP